MLKDRCYAAWHSDPAQAVRAAAALAALAAQVADPEVLALAAWAAAIAGLAEGRMEQALDAFDLAAARFAALAQPHTAASTQVGKLMALAMLGRYEEAVACGVAARDALAAHGDEAAVGRIELNLGNIALRRDQYGEAEQHYRAAHARLARADEPALLARVESGLADVLARRRQIDAARALYEQALARAEAVGLAVVQAEAECNLGNLALAQGRYHEALAYLERSRRRYAALELPHESAYADLELAEAYLELNLAPEAAAIFARVIPVFAELGMRSEHAWALAHAGQTALLLGDHEVARRHFAAAGRLFADEGNAVSAALVALFEARLLFSEGRFAEAAARAGGAESTFREAGNSGRALLAAWLRGEALLAAGDAAAARPLLAATLGAAEAAAAPQIAQRCATALGRIAAAAGDVAAAEALLTRAVATIEELRAPLPAEEFRTAFLSDKLSPYAELVRLCLAAGRVPEALAYVEQARSRALVELLSGPAEGLARPRDPFEAEQIERLTALRQELNWCYQRLGRALAGDGYDPGAVEELQGAAQEREAAILELTRQIQQRGSGDLVAGAPFDLPALQAELGAETALVAYYSLDDELLAFVVTAEAVRVVRELASEQEIEALVAQLRFQTDALRRAAGRNPSHQAQLLRRAQHYLGRLYEALLRPMAGLVGGRRLAVVPHRALHYVPFHALYDGERYVVEEHEICTAPSAAVLHHCLRRPSPGHGRAVFLGVPDALAPSVRDEILAVAPLWPERVTLLDDEATLEALRRHAPEAAILHLACHGQFRSDSPLFSSLRLADGWLTVRDAYGLDLACDLVVLSACETGVSALAAGDELIGLARGFFTAGAPALVVSLWTVDDATTAELMATFYERLRAGERPAAALRHAQRAMLARHGHPFFWAPFVLMGRW
ncbi:MAG TPA: CHAT domain-containing protein [Chloroflexaceae bacterium]|nr:CHAT domain-containing protein [Chloroflexaceae bacterium]